VIVDLLIGLPDQRPGGLLLSVICALAAGAMAVLAGLGYATACVAAPRLTLVVQGALALLRGVPLLLLIFAIAQLTGLPLWAGGVCALFLYSLSHVGEVLRAYLATYPVSLREQAHLLGISPAKEWLGLRIPWVARRSLDALGTHWISLLKDTGALTVLGIGELTTVAKLWSERQSTTGWLLVLCVAAALYLVAVLALARAVSFGVARLSEPGGRRDHESEEFDTPLAGTTSRRDAARDRLLRVDT
jgi:polar amino acid transport system permease protein